MNSKLLLLNYGAGNLASVRNALDHLQISYDEIDSAPSTCSDDSIILLPGVGSFSWASAELYRRGFLSFICDHPRVIGICLGMQLLFSDGEEGGLARGLGLIEGHVRSINDHPSYAQEQRIPHVGWQSLNWNNKLAAYCISDVARRDMYFVHSYMAYPSLPGSVLATVSYGEVVIPAVVAHQQVIGFQFHPEKSGPAGLDLLSMSISWLRDNA
jgi:glutamine amidotransferase